MAVTDSETLTAAVEEHEADLEELLKNLEAVNDLLDILALGSAALDDEMVVLLARTADQFGELADTASDPSIVRGLESVLVSIGEASDESRPPEPVGAIGLVRALRDPEVKRGLGFMIAVAGALGAELDRSTQP